MKRALQITSLTLATILPGCSDRAEPLGAAQPMVDPVAQLVHPDAEDQDDMCIWAHPDDPELSLIITSDKAADRVFIYDLPGNALQSIKIPRPGNIDLRTGVRLGDEVIDIVAVNQRDDPGIVVFEIDRNARRLRRIDGGIETGDNYGGCLYHSSTGSAYVFLTSERGEVTQVALNRTTSGAVTGEPVRTWSIGACEGAVADDDRGLLYIADEKRGVWRLGAEPDDPTPGELIINVGEDRLTADVEGLALLDHPNGERWLVVSSQGAERFFVYRVDDDSHRFLGSFAVRGARETDGIDVFEGALGEAFPNGVFTCHTDAGDRPVLLVRLEEVFELVAGSDVPLDRPE